MNSLNAAGSKYAYINNLLQTIVARENSAANDEPTKAVRALPITLISNR